MTTRQHPTALLSVYRARNASLVHAIADPLVAAGAHVSLWALDEVVPSLAPLTRGTGPGAKFDLLNGLLAEHPPPRDAYVVVSDDDITFTRGSVESLARWMRRAALGLAQPAHEQDSHASHPFTKAVDANVRLTTFVEIGPVFAVSPEWREAVLPFPADVGMGWGIELEWTKLVERGCRLGIVDAVRLRHHVKPGTDYDVATAYTEMQERFAAHGVTSLADVQRELARWRRWRPRPPWH